MLVLGRVSVWLDTVVTYRFPAQERKAQSLGQTMSKLIDGQIIGKPQVDWSLKEKVKKGGCLVDVFMLAGGP